MRKIFTIALISFFAIAPCMSQNKSIKVKKSKIQPIQTKIPKRPAGQKHVIGLTAPKIDIVRVGFIGLGMRGPSAVERFTHIKGVEIKALCDLHLDRVEKTQKILENANFPKAAQYYGKEGWKELCQRDDIDLVYIVTDWKNHEPMAAYAMEQGKHVAVEVPGAMTLDEIWNLINISERTRKHCMMLENCVYDFFELTTLNMIQQGLFGEILYADGAYIHQLEEFWNAYESNWRLDYNIKFRGDVYPTHGMGPACQALNIHRGDKMNYLVAMDSKPVSIPAFIEKNTGKKIENFQNGQQTITLIRTEKERTIEIHHDVATPRPYSRMYNIAGTKGYASKYPTPNYAFQGNAIDASITPDHENLNAHTWVSDEVRKEMMEKYKHPLLVQLEEIAKQVGGHGGMDFIMDYRLVYCLQNGLPLDMDVYDLAEWSCLPELTRISLENNSAPVAIPDFTRGYWNLEKGYSHKFVK